MRSPFPDRPEQRRTIVALSEAEYDRCGYDDEGRALLGDSGTWVVPVPVPQEVREAPQVQRLLDQAALFEGQVLLQSPYRFDDYAPAESYTERMAIQKHFLFSELCRRLGAKRVQVSTVSTLTNEGTISLDITGNKKLAKGELHVEKGHLASFASRLKLDDTFTDPAIDERAARELLAENHLEDEPVMGFLIIARTPGGSSLATRTFTVDVTHETNDRLKGLGRLQVPLFLKVSADLNRLGSNSESYQVTYKVTF